MKFRRNVAALITYKNEYLACCRKDYRTWQTVQGGIENFDISPMAALIREMNEELGIKEDEFKVLVQSKHWRRYHFTKKMFREEKLNNAGQDQLWFLVELIDKKVVNLESIQISHQEFEKVEWLPLDEFLNRYAIWKKAAVYDFCRELGLLSV